MVTLFKPGIHVELLYNCRNTFQLTTGYYYL